LFETQPGPITSLHLRAERKAAFPLVDGRGVLFIRGNSAKNSGRIIAIKVKYEPSDLSS